VACAWHSRAWHIKQAPTEVPVMRVALWLCQQRRSPGRQDPVHKSACTQKDWYAWHIDNNVHAHGRAEKHTPDAHPRRTSPTHIPSQGHSSNSRLCGTDPSHAREANALSEGGHVSSSALLTATPSHTASAAHAPLTPPRRLGPSREAAEGCLEHPAAQGHLSSIRLAAATGGPRSHADAWEGADG